MQRFQAKSLRVVLLAVLSCIALQAFAQASKAVSASAPAASLVQLRLANLGIGLGSMPQAMAIERGTFAKHGIDLQVINFVKGGAEATAGVASGQVDMGVYGTPILTGISFGLPIKIVGSPPNKAMNFELVAQKGINSVKELKGKVVTSGALGGGNHQALLKILKANGLSETDVSIVATGGTDAEMILRSGKVAAVMTGADKRRKMEDDGVGTLVAKAVDYYGHYQHSFTFATNAFIKAHPESVRGFLRATRESVQYSQTHLDELVDFSAARIKLPKETIRAYFLEQFKLWDPSLKVDIVATANAVKIVKELKEIKPNVAFDPNTWLDLRFLD